MEKMLRRSKSPMIFLKVSTRAAVFLSFFVAAVTGVAATTAQSNQFAGAIESGKVLNLDESNFDAAISTFDYIFVDFYAPWCGFSKLLDPELEKAAAILARLKQPIVVAKVDACKYRKLAYKHGIDGFPTLKIFVHGVPTEYNGPRKADSLVQFLKKFVAPDVAVLSSDSAIREFVEAADTHFPIFMGFGLDETKLVNLAVKYKKKARFAVAKDFSDEIIAFYHLRRVPAVVSLLPEYREQSVFYGPFKDHFFEDYVKQCLLPLALPINQGDTEAAKI